MALACISGSVGRESVQGRERGRDSPMILMVVPLVLRRESYAAR